MIKLRYTLPHSDGTEQTEYPIEFDGDSATIGRDKDCEIRIQQPYVSKRHARILRGVVVVDLGSANGTFVAGERVREATVLQADGRIVLGKDDVVIDVEVDDAGGLPGVLSSDGGMERELLVAQAARHESENAELRLRLEDLERELAAAREDTTPAARVQDLHEQMDTLRAENVELQRRVGFLKLEIESREQGAAENPQARMLAEELERVRKRCDDEQRRAQVAEQRAQRAEAAEKEALSGAHVAQLEAQLREAQRVATAAKADGDRARQAAAELAAKRDEVQQLRGEIEALGKAHAAAADVRAPAPGAGSPKGEFLALLQAENARLKQRVADLEARGVGGKGEVAPELFLQLRAENDDLRKRLRAGEAEVADLRRRAPAGGAAHAPAAAPDSRLLAQVTELERKNRELTQKLAERPRAQPVPAAVPAAVSGGSRVIGLLNALSNQDPAERAKALTLPVDEFTVTELFRCVREVERVVTRQAGEYFQLYNGETIMPGTERENLRSRLRDLLANNDQDARHKLVEYFDLMRRWLAPAVLAPKLAAARMAEELRQRLIALDALVPKKARRNVAHAAPAEEVPSDRHWREALDDPRRLSADVVEDRITKLTREAAEEIVASAAG